MHLYEIAAEKISKTDLANSKNEEIAKLKQSVQGKVFYEIFLKIYFSFKK